MGAAPSVEPRDYNKVLEAYVDESGDSLDIPGLVAYALYKRQKRDWIVGYRLQNDGRLPSDEEVRAVTSGYLNHDLRETLRQRASDILSDYAEVYVQALEPQIRQEALAGEMLRQARDIERSITEKSGLWRQVGTGLIATGLWTLLVTALVLAALSFGSDIVDMWRVVVPVGTS